MARSRLRGDLRSHIRRARGEEEGRSRFLRRGRRRRPEAPLRAGGQRRRVARHAQGCRAGGHDRRLRAIHLQMEGRRRARARPHRQEWSMKVEIKRVESPKELKAFVRFPYSIYKGDPCWVPPLDMDDLTTLRKDKNPAFEYCEAEYWMAFAGGKAVGRIAGIINNRVIEKWGRKYARFG